MAIYDYDQNQSQVFKSIGQFTEQSTKSLSVSALNLRQLIDLGEFQQALGLLKDYPEEGEFTNAKAVLLMRTGKPREAANLLRRHVWDLKTFTMNLNVSEHVRLNFATTLLMTGHVAGCAGIIRSLNGEVNEQANALLNAIRSWEESLSVLRWLDWKICGIEHLKGEFSIGSDLGRFGWEPKFVPMREKLSTAVNASSRHHDLAC
jgi:hypothetical protein